MTTAMVFPGMGPIAYADLARFALAHPAARARFAEADEAVGYRVLKEFKQSAEDYSEAAQVAFMVASVALAEWAGETLAIEPELCVGPSFGEKPMAAYVGALEFADAVRVTAGLARCTDEYFAEEHTDLVTLSFARVGGERLDGLLADLDDQGVWHEVSCQMDDEMFMVTLPDDTVAQVEKDIRALGGMPLYSMRPPMHASVFGDLRARVAAEVLDRVEFHDPRLPVISDLTGDELNTADDIRDLLLDGYTHAVQWPEAVAALQRHGVDRVCVAGPDALFGRVGCTVNNFEVVAADPRRALRPAA